ncbi:hypothetical protein MGI18_21290 [Bacillus sp. OVS6]|nr:hypothetical protein MGI18_21290 [Bacillus sp. OVS6]
MGNRADDLRRRMAKRKRDRSLGAERMEPQKQLPNLSFTDDEEKYGGSAYHTYDPGEKEAAPIHYLNRMCLCLNC